MAIWNKLTSTEGLQAAMWSVAFTGVSVLVAIGKVQPSMLEHLLFALVGGLALRGKNNVQNS